MEYFPTPHLGIGADADVVLYNQNPDGDPENHPDWFSGTNANLSTQWGEISQGVQAVSEAHTPPR